MYELAGDFTNKYFNYADPTILSHEFCFPDNFPQILKVNANIMQRIAMFNWGPRSWIIIYCHPTHYNSLWSTF